MAATIGMAGIFTIKTSIPENKSEVRRVQSEFLFGNSWPMLEFHDFATIRLSNGPVFL